MSGGEPSKPGFNRKSKMYTRYRTNLTMFLCCLGVALCRADDVSNICLHHFASLSFLMAQEERAVEYDPPVRHMKLDASFDEGPTEP